MCKIRDNGIILKKKVYAIGLLSGGLDSMLAVKLLLEQGIEVTGISFMTPFFGPKMANKAAEKLGIELIVKDITERHLEIVKNPPHGYGKTMNPCIDCHALMVNIAGQIMDEQGVDFIFTGEVLNERPMSQNRRSLDVVAEMSGYKEYLVRPLSAKLLEQTKPEKEGLLNRGLLMDIQGRSRKLQFELAAKYGIEEYPNPAGGCLLTDKNFSLRLKDLFQHNPDPVLRDLNLLKVGRHIRLNEKSKLIVGRNEQENREIEKSFSAADILLSAEHIPGPVCLLLGEKLESLVERAAHVCAAYSDAEEGQSCQIRLKKNQFEEEIKVIAAKADKQ
ncbi:MAG: tRNA 4-thiouridine(8) synthase ThiI [Candidatus Omnitrophica bacterium]|nr:tRNA 4-thiouridine(8) synthase ThiI [Candidatus Omnitrophota bacterium]